MLKRSQLIPPPLSLRCKKKTTYKKKHSHWKIVLPSRQIFYYDIYCKCHVLKCSVLGVGIYWRVGNVLSVSLPCFPPNEVRPRTRTCDFVLCVYLYLETCVIGVHHLPTTTLGERKRKHYKCITVSPVANRTTIISSKCLQCLFVGFSFAFDLKASYLFNVFWSKSFIHCTFIVACETIPVYYPFRDGQVIHVCLCVRAGACRHLRAGVLFDALYIVTDWLCVWVGWR